MLLLFINIKIFVVVFDIATILLVLVVEIVKVVLVDMLVTPQFYFTHVLIFSCTCLARFFRFKFNFSFILRTHMHS